MHSRVTQQTRDVNAGSMLGQRRRRWTNIEPALRWRRVKMTNLPGTKQRTLVVLTLSHRLAQSIVCAGNGFSN